MAFSWTEQRIRWYLDASRFGDFHKRLAEAITPYLLPRDRLCDLGCGLGQLDLHLASRVGHITCVDVDMPVLLHLRQEAVEQSIKNISILCDDARRIDAAFDVVLMTFFGYPPQLMFDCMRLAKRALIRVVNASPNGASLQPEKHSRRRESTGDIVAALDEAGCSYKLIEGNYEFGQPLKSEEEARAFVRCNSPGITEPELQQFLSENIVETRREDFPLYLPGKKELGIFVIRIL